MITEINEYQKEALVTADYASAEYPFLLLSEESGEVIGKINKFARKNKTSAAAAVKFARHEKDSQLRKDVIKELGDASWAWVVACTELDVDPAEVLQENINKLRDRQARGVICGSGDNR